MTEVSFGDLEGVLAEEGPNLFCADSKPTCHTVGEHRHCGCMRAMELALILCPQCDPNYWVGVSSSSLPV